MRFMIVTHLVFGLLGCSNEGFRLDESSNDATAPIEADLSRSQEIKVKGRNFVRGGQILNLHGNHTWNTVQAFDGERQGIASLVGNFHRIWIVETLRVDNRQSTFGTNRVMDVEFVQWKRRNGKFDLEVPNEDYYGRLKGVVKTAQEQNKVLGILLFDGAFNRFFGPTSWEFHPLNPKNNIQGAGPDSATFVHSIGRWNKYQKAHVKRVVELLAPFPNVIFEIVNEADRSSIPWQKKMVRYVKSLTSKPVGVSYVTRTANDWMKDSGADWFAPSMSTTSRPNLPGPVIYDTDHAWPLKCFPDLMRQAAANGMSVWLMDDYDNILRASDGSSRASCRSVIPELIKN